MKNIDSKTPPRLIEAHKACPPLPPDARKEAKKYTDIPLEALTKPQVLNLFRTYSASEKRKNLTIDRVANLYDRCRSTWLKQLK